MTTFDYHGAHPWMVGRTILLARHGSHAYGLATETSDLDRKGIFVPPAVHYHGFRKPLEHEVLTDPDLVLFEARKFFGLAAQCNPNMMEVIWAEEEDFLVLTPLGRRVVDARDQFLSKRAKHRFSGYAHEQLERIQRHYRWLKNPPKAPPTRTECGLPEQPVLAKDMLAASMNAVEKKLGRWTLSDMNDLDPATRIALQRTMAEILSERQIASDSAFEAAARTIGYEENFIEILKREREYKRLQSDWRSFCEWKIKRNPERAKLEEKFGFDTKHGSVLVRLTRVCREIATLHKVIVKRREDREELLDIRRGAWTYEYLLEWAAREDKEIAALYDASTLRDEPDEGPLNQLCAEIVEHMLAEAA